jgi:hypothetical protein
MYPQIRSTPGRDSQPCMFHSQFEKGTVAIDKPIVIMGLSQLLG